MKVLVTGGAGFIGSHIVDHLLLKGYKVRIIDSLSKPVHKLGKPDYLNREAEFIEGDITKREIMEKALQGVDVIFHQAAHQGFLPEFSNFFHTNSVGTALLLELIVNNKYPVQKIIFASSQAVYGEGKYRDVKTDQFVYPDPRPLDQLMKRDWEIRSTIDGLDFEHQLSDEDHANPHTQYAMSKYTQEMIAINLGKRHGIPTVGLRYSIVQGPRQSFFNAYSGILRIFSMRLINNQPPILYEDGQMKRDYIHIDDVAKANLLIMEDPRTDYQVYNVGSGIPITQLQFAQKLTPKLGRSIRPSIPGEFRLGDVRHIVSNPNKLKELGWEPKKTFDQILDDYIAWIETQTSVKDYFVTAEKVMKESGAVRSTFGQTN